MTTNVVGFYAPLTSTTFAVFDSGYKYMFDRFSATFRYVPLNGDIAGTVLEMTSTTSLGSPLLEQQEVES